jgi:hypothetical protein
VAKDDTSHAAPASAKATAVGVVLFFLAAILVAIAYALTG